MTDSFIIEGKAVIQSQEAGYVHAVMRVNGNPFVETIAEHFGIRLQNDADDGANEADVGRLRITVERISE